LAAAAVVSIGREVRAVPAAVGERGGTHRQTGRRAGRDHDGAGLARGARHVAVTAVTRVEERHARRLALDEPRRAARAARALRADLASGARVAAAAAVVRVA